MALSNWNSWCVPFTYQKTLLPMLLNILLLHVLCYPFCGVADIVQEQQTVHGSLLHGNGTKRQGPQALCANWADMPALFTMYMRAVIWASLASCYLPESVPPCSRSRRTDNWFRKLQDCPRAFVILALAAVVIGFVPHLYTLSVTVAFLLWLPCSIPLFGSCPNARYAENVPNG